MFGLLFPSPHSKHRIALFVSYHQYVNCILSRAIKEVVGEALQICTSQTFRIDMMPLRILRCLVNVHHEFIEKLAGQLVA